MALSPSGPLATPSSPHTHGGGHVRTVMGAVLIGLAPVTLFAVSLFGWPLVFLLLVTLATGLATEAVALRLLNRPVGAHLRDGSAAVTCLLLGLSLPASAPWWIGALGAAFALGIGKHLYGGLGGNPFNPAMIARVMLLIAFPRELTTWPALRPMLSEQGLTFAEGLRVTFAGQKGPALPVDAASTATPLGHLKTELTRHRPVADILAEGYTHTQALWGALPGSAGETSAVLILLGGGYLWRRRILALRIPLSMLTAVAILALPFHIYDPSVFPGPVFHLLNGALLFGAVFIATDPVTSPTTPWGQILFGLGCGALTYIIRTWGGYPEGVAFAVALMNAAVPLIDYFTRPPVVGKRRRGHSPPSADQ